jgi:hypothetical protein
MDFEKKAIPVPPPRPLMDFEKKGNSILNFFKRITFRKSKSTIPVPPPRPLMDFEKKSTIPVPPPRPLMDFEKKAIPVPPPRPLMDFEKKRIPVPPPRPLMDFEKKRIPVPPPRPLMDFEKKSIPVPPPRPLMDFEKKSIPVPPPRPLMDFEKKSIPVPPPRPLMDFEKKAIPVPPPRPLMDFEKKTTKEIKFKVEDDDDDFTFVPMMVEKTTEYPDEIINAHEKVMNELLSKAKNVEKNKKTNSILSAPTKLNNHCLLMYEIKNFKNKLNSVNSSIKENKMTPSTLKDMLLYEIKNHKINLKKTQEPVVRSNLNSRGYMAWELQNSNICKNVKETKKECKKVQKEMPKSLSPMQQIIWEIKNRDITLKKTVAITKKETPLKLSFPEQLVLEIKNHRPLRKVALEDIPKAIGGTRVSNEKDITLELLNKTANDVCNQSREKVYIVQQARQRLTSDDQYAKLLCSIKKFKKCGEENDEEINSSAYTKKCSNPMKNKYYGSANSNKNIWWDEEHKKIMRSIRRRNFSLRSIEDEVWVYVPPNHPAEKQKKSRFWLW